MPELMRDIHKGVDPVSVNAPMHLTFNRLAIYIADMAIASSIFPNSSVMRWSDCRILGYFSASMQTLAMAATARSGNFPAAVSAESMTASVPSMTAFATSETSALVGWGFSIMDSIICVAVITTLLRIRAKRISRFCSCGNWASPISTPKSPRATMMTSDSSMMPSMTPSRMASARSILDTMPISLPAWRNNSRASTMSSLERGKEIAK